MAKQSGNVWKIVCIALGLGVLAVWYNSSWARTTPHLAALDQAQAYHYFDELNQGGGPDAADDVAATTKASQLLEGWETLVGFWQGTLQDELRLIYRITSTPGEVYLYSLDQMGTMVGVSYTILNYSSKEGHHLEFGFLSIDGVYRAKLDPILGNRMDGVWSQGRGHLPLQMVRFVPTPNHAVPREYEFLLNKIITTDHPDQLVGMAGYWYGYLDDSFDEDEQEPPELVILQIEPITETLVEPKVLLPNETNLPSGLRSLVVEQNTVKLVLDDLDNNAIFQGVLDSNQTQMTGTVHYDDVDYTPPLVLTKSKTHPQHTSH